MQTYTQTFAGAQTWVLNVPGSYYSTINCTNAVTVRLFRQGQKLDLGEIKGLLAGLEVGPLPLVDGGPAFDRVEIDTSAADTVTIGIGNGQTRYNRSNATVTVVTNKVAQVAAVTHTNPAITTGSTSILAANANRQFLVLQNNDPSNSVWVNFGSAATVATGIKIGPGQDYPCPGIVPTTGIFAIGLAANANFVIAEG